MQASQSHNLKVTGSNPVPATKQPKTKKPLVRAAFCLFRIATESPGAMTPFCPKMV